ncbi:MAG: Uncharacterized protein CEO21_254 [Microgenomates group bacterium Gr01-1014_80]|nr:MAG: Uncharacterized protein CEO21_254 [Microgenomates group bacterium Gr01-1014_80]
MYCLWFIALCLLAIRYLPSTISAHSQTQIIEMTANGFSPDPVTIDINSTIIFLNKDKEARWPASNIHPTHEIYPEFDPKKPIEPGQSWSFKPKKAGTFKYHDHLLPHMRGTITVVSEEGETIINVSLIEKVKDALNNILDGIKGFLKISLGQKYNLGAKEFVKLKSSDQIDALKKFASSQGVEKTWQFVLDTYKDQAGSEEKIHDLAHLTGSLIYQKKGFSGVGLCSPEFAFGCFHGFLDEAFKKDLEKLDEAQIACSKLGPGLTGPVASCIHGIGHGVASFHGTSDLKASLASCRKLTSGTDYCFDGVFMEYVRSAPDDFFKKDDPLYPCNSLEKEFGSAYSFSCGRNQPSLLMSRFKMGFEEVVGVCLTSSSELFKEACFDALGFSLAASGDDQQIIQGCSKIGVLEYSLRCVKAGAGELVFQEVPNWQEKSEAVCNAISQSRDDCLRHIDRLILEYNRKKQINFTPIQSGEDVNLYVRREIKKCYDTGGKDGCYKDVAVLLYNQFGLKETLRLLKTNEGHQEVYARCHEVTHYLSRQEYEKQKSISKVYSQCDSTCHGGCYHGTLEAYLKEKNLQDAALANHFPTVCGKAEDYQKPLEFNECLHGMGHAAMFVTDMELMDSLRLCDTISDQAQKERCYTGVFMENSSSSTSFDHQSKYIKADDPFYPCNSLEEKYQKLCWQYQSSYFSIISNQNWLKVADMCLQIPARYQDFCFLTIGTNQVGFTPSLQTMKQDCDLMPSEHFQNICVQGVISSFSYRFVGDAGRMIEFCQMVDEKNKEACFKQMGTSLMDWTTDRQVGLQNCSKIPNPKGASWCMSVI